MRAFLSLSALARSLFALGALLLLLLNAGSCVIAAARRRYRFAALALALFLPVYLLWQVVFDLSLFGGAAGGAEISALLGGVPWALWLAAFAFFALASALLFACCLRFDRRFITPWAIKSFLDGMPCGVCCWRPSGRVLFSNECMNGLCAALGGGQLLDGNSFRARVKDGILTVGDRVWRFSCRTFDLDGETLNEMIASDVTTEYARTRRLEQDKAELSQLNGELREYYRSMDDAVRRQEILQAKANIHDEMNRLVLLTTSADSGDTEALDRIFALWEKNALLLCMEADAEADGRAAEGVGKLADALHVELAWDGTVPERLSGRQRALFYAAAREALVNAVKHAEAKRVSVAFAEAGSALRCSFRNDGKARPGDVSFTGGLANLARLAEQQGARVAAEAGDGFTLSLTFPENRPIG